MEGRSWYQNITQPEEPADLRLDTTTAVATPENEKKFGAGQIVPSWRLARMIGMWETATDLQFDLTKRRRGPAGVVLPV